VGIAVPTESEKFTLVTRGALPDFTTVSRIRVFCSGVMLTLTFVLPALPPGLALDPLWDGLGEPLPDGDCAFCEPGRAWLFCCEPAAGEFAFGGCTALPDGDCALDGCELLPCPVVCDLVPVFSEVLRLLSCPFVSLALWLPELGEALIELFGCAAGALVLCAAATPVPSASVPAATVINSDFRMKSSSVAFCADRFRSPNRNATPRGGFRERLRQSRQCTGM
jgi:hypothetical protein